MGEVLPLNGAAADEQIVIIVDCPYHSPEYHYGPFSENLAHLIEPSRLPTHRCIASCCSCCSLEDLTKLLLRCMCFWGVISIISIPICAVLSSTTGNNDWMVALAFIQMICVIGMIPMLVTATWSLYTHVRVYHIFLALFLAGWVQLLETMLNTIPGNAVQAVLKWNWMMYVGQDSALSGNSIAFGFKYVWSSVLFYLLLLALFPVLALMEELLFRARTPSWKSAIKRNLLFGAVHLFAGASVGTSLIILSSVGMFLTREYFEGVRRYALSCMIVDAAGRQQQKSINIQQQQFTEAIAELTANSQAQSNLFLRLLGYFEASWSPFSIAKWNSDQLDLSHKNILENTQCSTCHQQQASWESSDNMTMYVNAHLAVHSGMASSTVLHMTYNLVVTTIFCIQLATSR
eukprot:TRINITY_DN3278_c1_g2_i1.p1 TRINITY_DN3278_c1_g2~~TRINITY_DN3278_c1_g2_i1.p1  ORF type:complete len:436 (-),score=80.23 TRINITY_DN3278_c1_g2_i1:65-1276(-)